MVGTIVEIKIGRRYCNCKVIEYLGNGTHKVMDESENYRAVNLHNFLLNKKLRLNVQKHVSHIFKLVSATGHHVKNKGFFFSYVLKEN